MDFTDDHIAAFLDDPVIFSRALAYFREGRVLQFSCSPTQIEGEIDGSAGNRYRAIITLSNGKLHGACGCPYPLRCKHLGALLLEASRRDAIPEKWDGASIDSDYDFLEEDFVEDEGPPGQWNRESAEEDAGGEAAPLGRRELSQDGRHHHSWWSYDREPQEYETYLLPHGEEPQPGSKVLHLTIVAEPSYSTIRGVRLYVTPLLRYIRKDGTPGALSPWRPTVVCVARTPGEIEYLPELNHREGRKIPLSRLLPGRVLEGERIPLAITRPRNDPRDSQELQEAEFQRIRRLEISFFPVRYTGKQVLFESYLTVETDAGRRHPLNGKLDKGLAEWIEAGRRRFLVERRIDILKDHLGRRGRYAPEENHCWLSSEDDLTLLVDRGEGRVFWTGRRAHRRLLKELDPEEGRELSYPDILELQELLNRSGSLDSVELLAPPETAEIRELPPQLVIDIREGEVSLAGDIPFRGEPGEPGADGTLLCASDGSVIVARTIEELARLKRRLGLSGDGTVRLQEGEFGRLQELEELIEAGQAVSQLEGTPAAEILRRARERREAWLRLAKSLETLDRDEPPGFHATLRPYQRRGFAWLKRATEERFGTLLADDMGLGKTVQTLALIQANVADWAEISAKGPAPLSLVVAPPATIENWRHEILSFAPALTPLLYHGSSRGEILEDIVGEGRENVLPGAPILITSYQTLLKDAELLSEVEWDHLVFDEIQQIKNAKTKSYRAAGRLQSKRRIALSGTPVENSSLELYAVMDLLNPGILGSRASFLRRFGTPIERDGDQEARNRLRELLTPLVLRRRKNDVAKDLPPRDDIPVYVALPPTQRAVYESLRAQYQERVKAALEEGQPGKRLFLILEGLTRLRQAAVDTRLLPTEMQGAAAAPRGRSQESGKLATLAELVPDIIAAGHRILIFSQFVSLLTILREWAERLGYDYCYLDGSMSPARRKREIARFQEEQGPPLFLISLRAGGVGINLTAADYVILMDPWWNPAVEDQAIDRSHRIGQSRPVTAYRIIASDTVEERIAALQARKKALVGDIVPEESTIVSSLSSEEILDLFAP